MHQLLDNMPLLNERTPLAYAAISVNRSERNRSAPVDEHGQLGELEILEL